MLKLTTVALAIAAPLLVPAFARDKAPTPAIARIAPAVLKAAQAADTALAANDTATAEPLVVQAETASAATTDADRYVAAALRYRLEAAKIAAGQQAGPNGVLNQTALAKPLDALIANPVTPKADKARFAFQRGQLAYFGRQYPTAARLFAQARELGYDGPELALTSVRASFDGGDVANGGAELDRVIAAQAASGQPAPPDYYRYAIARSNKTATAVQAVGWMNRYIAAYPVSKTWYEVLTTYGLQQGATAALSDVQKLDVYRLMRATGAMPDAYAYTQYALLARTVGLTLEAQAVLKEGVAKDKLTAAEAGTKPAPAGKTAAAGKAAANRGPATIAALEAKVASATTGVAAVTAGDANLGAGNDAKAATLYGTALGKGGVDADAVNTHLGIALARSGDKAGAQAAFAAVKGTPNADIAAFWTTWLTTSAR